MTDGGEAHDTPRGRGRALCAYLLGTLGHDDFLAFQRRLVYDVTGDRDTGAVVLCDHPPGVTIGREGSRLHVRPGPEELHARGWPVRWVSRGGGAMLHLPGQVACYPIVALDRLNLTPAAYLGELQSLLVELLREYDITATSDPDHPGVRVGGRRIAHVGVAVRSWVACFGLVLNADPDLEPFRDVFSDGDPLPMTSVQRETPMRVRASGVRQRLVDLVADRFGFDRVSLFHTHPAIQPRPTHHAAVTRTR